MEMNMNDEAMSMMLEKSWDKFPGHIAPGTAFICVGSFALLKTLWLSRELPPGVSFAQAHLPFRDLDLVRKFASVTMVVSVAGAIYHSLGEGIDTSIFLHMTLYSSFFMCGLAGYLESRKLLPPDAGRSALAVTYFLTSLVWYAHGISMMAPVNRNVHVYTGLVNLISGLVMTYSVIRNNSTVAHILSWALMILQGFWLYFIAFYLCCLEIEANMVEPYLCLLCIFLAIVIFTVIACSDLPHVREAHSSTSSSILDGRGEYEVLAKFQNHNDPKSDGSQGTVESHDTGDDAC